MAEMNHADILIIGAGIAGAGLAAMIARHKKVIILEAEDHPGYHSTGRSAAVLIQNYGNQSIRQLTRLSRPYLVTPPQSLCDHSLLHERGCLFVETDEHGRYLYDLLSQSEGLTELTKEDACKLVPALRPDKFYQAAYEAAAGDIDVAALHQGWLKAAKAGGAKLIVNARVTRITRQNCLWSVEAGSAYYKAPVIVNAAGAWADHVAEMARVKPVGIIPKRRTIAVLPELEPYKVSQWPMFGNINDTWYAKPETGRLLVSPADEDPVAAQDIHVDDMVLAEGLYRFEQAVNYPVRRVERSWAGLRCFAADNTPVVGFASDADDFFWLAGQGGYGIQTSPALSRLAASLVMKASPDDCYPIELISALSPLRFFA